MAYKTSANLFEVGDFISHAGKERPWKIECDAIRPEWWDALARMVMDYQERPFYKAVGIPRGGVPFAQAMNKYASGDPNDQIMICDDVVTTGTTANIISKLLKQAGCKRVDVFALARTDKPSGK